VSNFSFEQIRDRGHPIWAEIDPEAIRHNIRALGSLAGRAEVMGVVKGYAYGHGNPEAARAMLEGGASRLGVARVAEALHLRDAGIEAPIQVFSEPPEEAARALATAGLTPTVYTVAFARALSAAAQAEGLVVPVHVKIDTGMHRVGLSVQEAPDAVALMAKLPGIEVEGAWSHLAVADTPDHPFNKQQLETFLEVTEAITARGIDLRSRHIANSAATISSKESHLDMVRCGIAAYGLWPGPDFVGKADLRPALALRARISMVKEVPAGDRVSYGLRYELPRAGRVVTVGGGYADGYDRRLSGQAEVLIRGRRFRVSGTVCMDQFMVDVGDADAEVGDIVTLIGSDGGESISAEELAGLIGTINYEVTTRIPSRVPRIFGEAGDAS
jgi:alanine racemase